MISLKKGNKDDLEGRVTVYSKFKLENEKCKDCDKSCKLPSEEFIFAMYVTSDPVDFSEKTGAPKEKLKEVEEMSKKEAERLSKFIKDEIKGLGIGPEKEIDVGIEIVNLYASPKTYTSEKEILEQNPDILDAGTYASTQNCAKAVQMGIDLYFMKFKEQIGENFKINGKKAVHLPNETFKDFPKQEIKRHMMDNYVVPMLDSKNSKEEDRFSALKSGLLNFCKGSDYVMDAINLSRVIEKGRNSETDLKLIEHYVNKMNAVNLENYEEAGKIKKEIDAIMQSKQL